MMMNLNSKGKDYWRSLDQLADTPEFQEFLVNEFPKGTVELAGNNWSRRNFLTLMGASMAMAGLAGCRRPVEKVVPYVTRPEEIMPGVPNQYATTMPLGMSACGLVLTSHEGRPTKIEGNKLHPSSLGAVNPMVQASILGLYDPDRSKSILHDGAETTWGEFVKWWQSQHAKYAANGGEGLAVLSETFNSPTLARWKRQFIATFPKASWVSWEPISDENIYAGIEIATGRKLQPVYDFSKAKVILALDCDFLGFESEAIAAARGFANGRRVESRSDDMNRLYAVESSLSITGMMADHRLRLNPDEMVKFLTNLSSPNSEQTDDRAVRAIINDLRRNRGESLVIAGRSAGADTHAAVAALNDLLGNVGTTVNYVELPDASLADTTALVDLVGRMAGGKIETLIIAGGNPVYNAPADLNFEAALGKVGTSICLSENVDETSGKASWHINRAHYLESWGDVRSVDGSMSVMQPMIEPLFGGHADVEVLSLFASGKVTSAHDSVRESWRGIIGSKDFEKTWRRVLHDGVLDGSALPSVAPKFKKINIDLTVTGKDQLHLIFVSGSVFDGRFANNGWLQELPDAANKLTWDNVALVSPATAGKHDLKNEDVVTLTIDKRTLEMPVWISPGQADNSVTVALGYGRMAAGKVGDGVGVDTYKLRTSSNMWFARGLTLVKTGRKYELACTQDHGSMEGRPIVRENTLAAYKETGEFFPEQIKHPPLLPLWDEHLYDDGYQWGMSIDLNACMGCNACVVACQSENNIPVVGKEQVRNGREMHWLRIDRYYSGDENDPDVVTQPMACMHCEMAPCEEVCPVAATVHDDEGLNVMVYNRCIGTRYCSNNCPYKVRRFNFFNYTKELPLVVQMVQNPDVTVRSRGVMEKCTYCVQRINSAKIASKRDGRLVADGEIVTACEQACPAQAIRFGNVNDPQSELVKLKQNDRAYNVLEELNIKPRTSYLAKLRNRNPEFDDKLS